MDGAGEAYTLPLVIGAVDPRGQMAGFDRRRQLEMETYQDSTDWSLGAPFIPAQRQPEALSKPRNTRTDTGWSAHVSVVSTGLVYCILPMVRQESDVSLLRIRDKTTTTAEKMRGLTDGQHSI